MVVNLEERIVNIMEKGASQKVITGLLNAGLRNTITRRALINAIEKATYRMSFKGPDRPDRVKRKDIIWEEHYLIQSIKLLRQVEYQEIV